MKKCINIILFLCVLVGCKPQKEIVILFDNDAHCAVEGYAHMAALRKQFLQVTPFVSVVSAGDFVQGDVVGSLSRGQYIIDIMNAVPYDYVTLGNHEFDYSIPRQLELMNQLSAEVLCCNLTDLRTHQQLYPAYSIRKFGHKKIAFIGVATPTTFNTSTPTYFMDEDGIPCYTFHYQETFSLVQQAVINARKEGADYVVVLSHLGDDTYPVSSLELISATNGIDIVIDGHSHSVINQKYMDAAGDSVLLVSTGTKFANIGCLTIATDGLIACKHIHSINYDAMQDMLSAEADIKDDTSLVSEEVSIEMDSTVIQLISNIRSEMQSINSEVVGHTDFVLTDVDVHGNRLVRCGETNLADFIADAMRCIGDAQIGCIHGGSIRTSIPAGDITLGHIMAVLPFNNNLAKVSITGQQLLDALEVSVAVWPIENGDFHIFSGLRYTIDPSIKSSVVLDEQQLFVGVRDTRRVVKAEVQINGEWIPINANDTYTMAGIDYTLLNNGASGMFRNATPLPFEGIKDTDILIRYLNYLGGIVTADYASPQGRFLLK